MPAHNYKELNVWKKSVLLTETVYAATKNFPTEERFGITSQIRRAVVSVPVNIAEGSGRSSDKDFRYFLHIAYASSLEVETRLILCKSFLYVSNETHAQLTQQVNEVQRMLNGLMDSLNK